MTRDELFFTRRKIINRRSTNFSLFPLEYFPFLKVRHKQNIISATVYYDDDDNYNNIFAN